MRVLLIDDDLDYVNSQIGYLRERGHDALGKYSQRETVEYLEGHAKELDLALIDMYMEDDEEAGLKIVQLIDRRYPWIIPIIVTGHGDFANAIRCMENGAFSYIMKGESPPGLVIATINQASARLLSDRVRVSRPYLQDLKGAIDQVASKIDDMQELLSRMIDEIAPNS